MLNYDNPLSGIFEDLQYAQDKFINSYNFSEHRGKPDPNRKSAKDYRDEYLKKDPNYYRKYQSDKYEKAPIRGPREKKSYYVPVEDDQRKNNGNKKGMTYNTSKEARYFEPNTEALFIYYLQPGHISKYIGEQKVIIAGYWIHPETQEMVDVEFEFESLDKATVSLITHDGSKSPTYSGVNHAGLTVNSMSLSTFSFNKAKKFVIKGSAARDIGVRMKNKLKEAGFKYAGGNAN